MHCVALARSGWIVQGLAAYLFRTAIGKTSASQTHRCIAQCQQVTRSSSIFSSALSSQQLHQMASQDPPTTASTSSGVPAAPGPSGRDRFVSGPGLTRGAPCGGAKRDQGSPSASSVRQYPVRLGGHPRRLHHSGADIERSYFQ